VPKPRNEKRGPVPHTVLSDRGVYLEQAHQRAQCNSIGFGQVVVLENNDNPELRVTVTIGQRCPKCKMRVRGQNHIEGAHHRGCVTKCGDR
jgi:hypothetical protein